MFFASFSPLCVCVSCLSSTFQNINSEYKNLCYFQALMGELNFQNQILR